MIQKQRIKRRNERPAGKGRYVLYWMQASQRADYNHALEYAIEEANALGLPVQVVFGLFDRFPEANARHFAFLLEGLADTGQALEKRGIGLALVKGSPEKACLDLAKNAALLVMDRGYLRVQRAWREKAAKAAPCPAVEVESDVVVPVETASVKEAFSAGTLRPAIHRHLEEFLVPLRKRKVARDSLGLFKKGFDYREGAGLVKTLRVDGSVPKSPWFKGGTNEALKQLRRFIEKDLASYGRLRNDPGLGVLSRMSPYLHFGQISPLKIALEALKSPHRESTAVFLEELIVRRELSMNFVFYNPDYDRYACLHPWALKTLDAHRRDHREYLYTLEELDGSETHDPFWNAAQTEMRITGKMHGYMRMYWGKKILEWSPSPEEAFERALYLNNRYELDGRDPNGYAGVAWCFGKHDRAWGERPVFGKVRYMNAAGLRRKFDMQRYLKRVEDLEDGLFRGT